VQAVCLDVAQADMMRSFLFVPADSERKLARALDANADALIVDLEDSVLAHARPEARKLACGYLAGKENVWVRINPIDTDDAQADLEAVMPSAPAGIVLPKPGSANETIELASRLDALEAEHGLQVGSTRILPLCTEKPEALFTLGSYIGASERLLGLSWGAEDLSAAVGATTNRDEQGNWLPAYELARSLCLLAASAAQVLAIDTVYTDFKNEDGLRDYANKARRDGFSGMLAIHPAQIAAINNAFMPSSEELDAAARIVELFEGNPQAGALSLDGKMIDRPHLIQARRTLQCARYTDEK
jgi:citrate lyase subunit beta/citryl-CoA lyase